MSALKFKRIDIPFYESDEQGKTEVLLYERLHQEQTNWCWAAVSLAVARYYGSAEKMTQGRIVNGQLAREDCCGDVPAAACNVPNVIYGALEDLGHYAHKKEQGKQGFENARGEIAAGRPLAVLVRWNGGGGHFLAVIGYADQGKMLQIADPWYGESLVAYEGFPANYQHGADWGWTYWTSGNAPTERRTS